MVMTTSAARTISSVHGLGYSVEMSMPRSFIAAMAEGLTWSPGSEPPDKATEALPGETCGEEGQEVGDGGMPGELVVGGVQEPVEGFDVERAVEVASEPGGGGLEGDDLVEGDVVTVVELRHRRSLLRDRFKTRVGDGARDR